MSEKVKKILIIASAVLFVVLAGSLVYIINNNKQAQQEVLEVPSVTAVISPVSSITTTVIASQTSTKTATALSSTATPAPSKSSEQLIKEAFATKFSDSESNISIQITKSSDGAAYGMVTHQGEGGWFLAVKDGDSWKILDSGNGILDCSILVGYDVPNTVVEECYDIPSETSIKR